MRNISEGFDLFSHGVCYRGRVFMTAGPGTFVLIMLLLVFVLSLRAASFPRAFSEKLGDTDALVLVADPYSGRLKAWTKLTDLDKEMLPGSVFKIITSLAVMAEGTDGEKVFCDYYYPSDGAVLDCTYAGGHGEMDFSQAIIHSCNYYFYRQAELVDMQKIIDILSLFKEYTVPYPEGALPGYQLAVGLDDRWRMSPKEVLELTMAVVNGGLIYRLILPEESIEIKGLLPVLPSNLLRLGEILTLAVEEGTGKKAAMPGLSVAGKTGTSADGAWFTCAFPMPGPQFALLVFLPQGSGGEQAAALAAKVIAYFRQEVF